MQRPVVFGLTLLFLLVLVPILLLRLVLVPILLPVALVVRGLRWLRQRVKRH